MENTEINTTQNETFAVNREIKLYLSETAKWGNVLAIVGYVAMGMMALASLVMIVAFSFIDMETVFPMWIVGIVYLLLAGVYYIPVTYLYRFSAQIKLAVHRNDEKLYTTGFENLKSLFKFLGIFTFVLLGLYALVLVGAVAVQIFMNNTNVL
ncbi:MAG: hypothetical protein Q7U86_09900 [Draconibacterium sp.]|nr:hypothetical protein [Draconibacterium sp.]